MLFNSLEYLLFLPLVVGLFFLSPHRWRWAVLLVASYFFYMYWRPEYALLLLFSTGVDYWAAIRMHEAQRVRRKLFLWISVGSNLSLLFAFKYLDFVNQALRDTFSVLDFSATPGSIDILLPVGISFYTFQTLSYTLDVYRKRRAPERHFGLFALYVSFFPQLVAGPIERSTRLLPQFHERKSFSWQNIIDGGRLIIWGLFKKVILADTIGAYVNIVFDNPGEFNGFVLLLMLLGFGYQLYLDFSAYTDIAIGSARMMGYDLMANFNRPLMARTIREFWSRWHISLTTWMFDYLYRPLAKSWRLNWHLNIIILFLLIGIWHGAGWGFVVFGLLQGVFYLLSYYVLDGMALVADHRQKWIRLALHQLGWVFTMLLLMCTVVFFRAPTLEAAGAYLLYMVQDFSLDLSSIKISTRDIFLVCTAFPIYFFVQWQRNFAPKAPFLHIPFWWVRWGIYYFMIFYLLLFGQRGPEEFIYFQF